MTLPIEMELNELRSELARVAGGKVSDRQLKALMQRIDALEKQSRESVPGESERAEILRALATANAGKPGFLSLAQIEEKCNMTKSAVHHHTNELEKAGKVWIRKTHDHVSGRPHFVAYDPRAVRA